MIIVHPLSCEICKDTHIYLYRDIHDKQNDFSFNVKSFTNSRPHLIHGFKAITIFKITEKFKRQDLVEF